MSRFILLDIASIFMRPHQLLVLSKRTVILSNTNNILLVFIFLIALLDHSLDF